MNKKISVIIIINIIVCLSFAVYALYQHILVNQLKISSEASAQVAVEKNNELKMALAELEKCRALH